LPLSLLLSVPLSLCLLVASEPGRVRTVDLGLACTLTFTLDLACTLASELEHEVTPCALGKSLLIVLDQLPDLDKAKKDLRVVAS